VYLVHPFRTLHRPQTVSAALATAMLLADESYYLGGLWAFTLNRLSEQVYSSAIDAFVTREYRARTLGNARVKFQARLLLDRGHTFCDPARLAAMCSLWCANVVTLRHFGRFTMHVLRALAVAHCRLCFSGGASFDRRDAVLLSTKQCTFI
jgi:hypothetical protein